LRPVTSLEDTGRPLHAARAHHGTDQARHLLPQRSVVELSVIDERRNNCQRDRFCTFAMRGDEPASQATDARQILAVAHVDLKYRLCSNYARPPIACQFTT